MAGTYRIVKVANELNISRHTIVEFLAEEGIEVDDKPTSKLSEEAYKLLLEEFQEDKLAKEESKSIEINKFRGDRGAAGDSGADEEGTGKEEEILIKSSGSLSNVDEIEDTTKEEKPAEKKVEEKKEEEKPKSGGLKVVGKIDLDADKKAKEAKKKAEADKKAAEEKAAADKKAADEAAAKAKAEADKKAKEKADADKKAADEAAAKAKADAEKKAKEETAKPKEEAEKPKVAAKKEEEKPAEEVEKEREVIKPKMEKLKGLSIMGKIELPADKPKKKPVASSDASVDKFKKKRKRKTIDGKPAGTRTGAGGNNNRPGGDNKPGFKRPDNRNNNRGGNRSNTGTPEKTEISDKEIQDKIKSTLAKLSGGKQGNSRQKLRRQKRDSHQQLREEEMMEQEKSLKTIQVTEFVSAAELAQMMDVTVNEIITACFSLGMMVSINQRLDAEAISIVADEFGFEVEFVSADVQDSVLEEEIDDPKDLVDRPPIVTVMGHVDHGKTSLLDHIRSANVIAGEAGGITQHIGAYEVTLESGKKIAFLDTPGHEAFTAMRARGAKVTDIVIVVVAADDNVMPQTKEAISHAQAAGVPIVFAINKIDKEGANPDRIREELSAMNILVEDWGGKYQSQEISAKKGLNIDELLEKVLLEAELLELKANPNKRATGTVIEAQLDKGRGIVTTLLVQSGTLRVGDPMVAGTYASRVRALFNERNQKIEEAGPSTPCTVLGFSGAPTAGDKFHVLESEQEAKEIANKRSQLQREQGLRTQKHITLDEIGRRLAVGNFKELNIIVKGDVDGSVEALADSLQKLSTEEIQVNVIHKSVGQISETDVMLASASDAVIIGFQVRPSAQARKLAEAEQIDIRLYSIIYKAIEELTAAMEGMLAPDVEEKITCNVEVRDVFKVTKVGTVAGCMVTEGKINRNSRVRIIREGVVVYTGELESLKRFKDDVKEVASGFECGLNIKNFNDIKVGDVIEGFEEVEVKRKLTK